jgi:hypothetical protein
MRTINSQVEWYLQQEKKFPSSKNSCPPQSSLLPFHIVMILELLNLQEKKKNDNIHTGIITQKTPKKYHTAYCPNVVKTIKNKSSPKKQKRNQIDIFTLPPCA